MADSTRLLVEKHWMLFVDGENFTKRGQAVLEEAKVMPVGATHWRKDVFLWLPRHSGTAPFIAPSSWPFMASSPPSVPQPQAHFADRAYYYTSMPYENQTLVTATKLALREIGFEPRMFQRRREKAKVAELPPGDDRDDALARWKSKAVDLALATDVLTLAGERRYEVAVLFAGDADYVPVVEAVKRLGRHVVLGFFAGRGHGLSDDLRIAADEFVDLSPYLVRSWTADRDIRQRESQTAANEGVAAVKSDE
jgi:uncharacterized LabA/DUF88 family protein